jgi:RNA polymerase sigma-70 factor (ECF subfamily)
MREGDHNAFEQCYRILSPIIYSTILRVCNRPAIAEEVMQDSFIDAFSSLNTLNSDGAFVSWIKRIAFNKAINIIRQNKEITSVNDAVFDGEAAETFDINIIQKNQLAYLMGHLTEEAKLVVWLFIVEGYSHQEIAELAGNTVSYSKSIVSRSLTKLREIEQGHDYAL